MCLTFSLLTMHMAEYLFSETCDLFAAQSLVEARRIRGVNARSRGPAKEMHNVIRALYKQMGRNILQEKAPNRYGMNSCNVIFYLSRVYGA